MFSVVARSIFRAVQWHYYTQTSANVAMMPCYIYSGLLRQAADKQEMRTDMSNDKCLRWASICQLLRSSQWSIKAYGGQNKTWLYNEVPGGFKRPNFTWWALHIENQEFHFFSHGTHHRLCINEHNKSSQEVKHINPGWWLHVRS